MSTPSEDFPPRDLAFREREAGFSLTLKRNCSASPAALLAVFAVLASVVLLIGGGFAIAGAWLILPFAGLEVLMLGAAFIVYARRAADCEKLELAAGRLMVEVTEAERSVRYELDAWRARVRVESASGRGMRVLLQSGAGELEVGRHLDAATRIAFAAELKKRLQFRFGGRNMRGTKLLSLAAGALGLASSGAAQAIEWYFRSPASAIAEQIDHLHQYVMWLIIVIFIGVFSAMFWSCYAHRKSVGHRAEQFHENTTVEILWTVIPALILIVIAWPVTKTVVAQKDTSAPDLTVKVTGYQWKWGYDYVAGEGEGISFISTLSTPREQIEGSAPKGENYLLEVDNELVVPIGKKIRVLTTAADVVHSWWVPSFGAKQDAIPGFLRDTWFKAEQTGTFRSQCVELCGKEHGFMPIVVRVVSQDDYSKWVGEKKKAMAASAEDPGKVWAPAELVARGEKVYAANCVACHQASGQGAPPAFPPLAGSKVVTGPKEGQIDTVLNGRPNTAMAAFGKQLSDTDIAAVISYTRNSWGNKSGEVQPAEVKARHK